MNTPMRLNDLATAMLVALAASLVLGACGREDTRTAAQQLDAAVAKTEQGAAKAGAEIRQGANELGANAKATAARAERSLAGGANKAGSAVENATEKVSSKVVDAGITAGINAELAKDPTLSAMRINVDTTDSKVVLSGSAPSPEARTRATRLARTVKGVTSVDNRLEVRS